MVTNNVFDLKLDQDKEIVFFFIEEVDKSINVSKWILIVFLFLFCFVFLSKDLEFTRYVHVITVFSVDSVSATIAEMTCRRTVEVIHIERAAVSHLNVSDPVTTVWIPVKADLSGNLAISHCGMSTI